MATEQSEVLNPALGNLAKDPKATEDYTKETEEIIARAGTMAKAGRVDEAVDEILLLEKKARVGSDAISCSKLICCIIQLYYDKGDWPKLREYIVLMTKKRGQLKRATTDMVHLAMTWLDGLDKEKKLDLISTLNEVTDGKIFLEVEKARLTRMLAEIRENEGNIEEAANLMQEVQVETFGAMDKMEKANYILNQMRLVLLKKDFVRTQIISKKINTKLLEPDEFQSQKIQYYEYLVQYWLHEGKYLEVSKCFLNIFNTKIVQEDEARWKHALTCHALYLSLAMYDNEQSDMLTRLLSQEGKKMDKIPTCRKLIEVFIRQEIVPWPLPYEAELKAIDVFTDKPHDGGAKRWDLLKQRVVQHNIKIISGYYDQIHTKRLSELIGVDVKETEKELSELVCSKFLYAKINRPAGIVKFAKRQDSIDHLNNWSGNISKMLDLVESTCHLIQKEQMVHAARAKLKPKK